MIDFKNSVLVVAHPDDEILWFSSIIKDVDKIIIVFNETKNVITHNPQGGYGHKKHMQVFKTIEKI